jgi:hypothetical protein
MEKKGIQRRILLTGAVGTGLGILGTKADLAQGQTAQRKFPSKLSPVKTIAHYQVTAAMLANRIHHDTAFAAQLKKDPVKTLQGLGIGKDAVRELIHEEPGLRKLSLGGLGEVEGCTVTCICTDDCCFSCWFSLGFTAGAAKFGRPLPGVKVSPKRADLVQNLIEHGHIVSPE